MLRISFINVGYGDAILIEELRDERRVFSMLVDGGVPYAGDYRVSYDRWPSRVPAFRYLASRGIDALDAVFLTHLHIDHIGGLPEVLEQCSVGDVWSSLDLADPERFSSLNALALEDGSAPERATAREMRLSLNLLAELHGLAGERGIPMERLGGEHRIIALSDGLTAEFFEADRALSARTEAFIAEILSPDTEAARAQRALVHLDSIQNAAGVALRLTYGGRKILLPADLPAVHWKGDAWGAERLRADIVKLAHHGQADSMTRELAVKISPRHAVISVSADNPFGAPSPNVFDLFDAGLEFWTTENIEMPPRNPSTSGPSPSSPSPRAPEQPPKLARGPSRRAVIFEIQSDGEINVSLDRV